MFKPLTPSLIGILLIVGQALPAHADNLLAYAQPQSATLTAGKAALEQETQLVEQQNHVMPGIAIYAHTFGGDEANRLAKDGVLIGGNSVGNYIDLQSGNILLTPEENIVVGTYKGKVSIAAGANVFISASDNDVVIYDLLQTKPNQVSITINKHKLVMEPGRMLVVTAQDINDFEKLDMNCHCVAYRNATSFDINSKAVKVFMADFSIASALTTVQPLQRLTVSNHPEDKLAVEKLVKAAVVLGEFATSTAPTTQVANHGDSVQVADSSNH